jgi:hypothetical protein
MRRSVRLFVHPAARSKDDRDRTKRAIRLLSFRSTSPALRACVVGEQAGYAIDATTVQITTKAYVAEIRQRLDEAARSQRRHKPVPNPATPSRE